MGKLIKVLKCQIISMNENTEQNTGTKSLTYREVTDLLWQLQRETRLAANRTIQYHWEYGIFSDDYKVKNGNYPTNEQCIELIGTTGSKRIYRLIMDECNKSYASNVNTTMRNVEMAYKRLRKDILVGKISVPNYKSDIPIDLHGKSIHLSYEKDNSMSVDEDTTKGVKNWYVDINLFSKSFVKEQGLNGSSLHFKLVMPSRSAGSARAILSRCYDGTYKVCASKLVYIKNKWYLLLTYEKNTNEEESTERIENDNVMGVHIGEQNAVVVSFSNSKKQMYIDGGEVAAFAVQIERRKRNIGNATTKNSVLCGGGRVGHGYKTKMEPLEHINTKISNFRATTNHRYARQIVNWAIANKCGIIQLEDLTGWASENLECYTLLKNWSYYDLMMKIENKAKEAGIKVIKISYKTLNKWCSDCNAATVVEERNEDGLRSVYKCTKCGAVIDRDTHIPMLLRMRDIDKHIETVTE